MIEITTEQQQQINSVLIERYTELYNKSSNMLTNFFSLPNPNFDEFDKLNAPYEIEMNRINNAYYALNGAYIFTSDYDEE